MQVLAVTAFRLRRRRLL